MFFALGTIGTVPGLQDALLMLAERGFHVDLFVRGNRLYPPADFKAARMSVTSDRPGIFGLGASSYPWWLFGHGRKPYSWVVSRIYYPAWRSLVFRRELRAKHRESPYHCVIALDSQALVDCAGYADDLGVPIVYWSLELIFKAGIRTKQQLLMKEREVKLSREASLVIVQDPWRGAALVSENGLDPARVAYVPNAPRGHARRRPASDLRVLLGIPPERTVVLCSGALAVWAASLDLVRSAGRWPHRFVLVMQSRASVAGRREVYLEEVRRASDPESVRLLEKPVPAGHFRALVDSADIGVALYQPNVDGPDGSPDRNIELMGYASGKIATYLQSGLPVVTSGLVGLRDLAEGHGCGRCVESADEVGDALEAIMADYEAFSAQACQVFDEYLELERQFEPVLDRIVDLDATGSSCSGAEARVR